MNESLRTPLEIEGLRSARRAAQPTNLYARSNPREGRRSIYSMAKAALTGLVRGTAIDLAPRAITVDIKPSCACLSE
jgi:NAD(P)-dependent dehydrogenase (short-subunit alcohol dehydrogenase family)